MTRDPKRIRSQKEFVEFVDEFRQLLVDRPDLWGENKDIRNFLRALADSAVSVQNAYENFNFTFPEDIKWDVFATILWMAADYE